MYLPKCDIFWAGGYPAKDPKSACRKILNNPYLMLHWPQLPKKSSKERLGNQTYAALASKDFPKFPKGVASGWSAMWGLSNSSRLKNPGGETFKTQIAGPITLFGKFQVSSGGSEQKLLEYISLWLGHAFWQIDQIQKHDFKPLLVIDEPLLPTFVGPTGSRSSKRALKFLQLMVKKLHSKKAMVGVHCCNRISPSTLIDLGVDLVHFDAFYFPTQIKASRERLREFLKDGGLIAWGIIPTNETLTTKLQVKIEKNFNDLISSIESRNLPAKKILQQSMIAPTCGTGALTRKESDQIVAFATALSKEIKARYHF